MHPNTILIQGQEEVGKGEVKQILRPQRYFLEAKGEIIKKYIDWLLADNSGELQDMVT